MQRQGRKRVVGVKKKTRNTASQKPDSLIKERGYGKGEVVSITVFVFLDNRFEIFFYLLILDPSPAISSLYRLGS
ncbi:hypothetical protein L2E82_27129 [Cichorium intybus]|uniref:Uncharacterized protein n=1 Tax=Cichorium intybus TaxID=13427 RepID=A0ACB9CS49_CICIN|nr:hypothetical protein L2E82_27129 [Cichorium intybus]